MQLLLKASQRGFKEVPGEIDFHFFIRASNYFSSNVFFVNSTYCWNLHIAKLVIEESEAPFIVTEDDEAINRPQSKFGSQEPHITENQS